jgi:predicted metal-dependent peptidase
MQKFKRSIIKQKVKGRGGTELKPCWDLLKTDPKYKKVAPELIMIFTDGGLTQYKRNPRTMRNLCWVILDNPSWQLEYKDMNTKAVYIKTADVK